MKICKRICCAFFILMLHLSLMPLGIEARAAKYSDTVRWSFSEGVLTITGSGYGPAGSPATPWEKHRDQITEIVIKPGITGLGNFLFQDCNALTKVTLPEGLEEIGKGCFSGCRNLSDIQFPESLYFLDREAFKDCVKLSSITIPSCLKKINADAFRGCDGLQSVHIPSLEVWLSVEFEYCDTTPLVGGAELLLNGAPITEVVIPAGITKIPAYAFFNCRSLVRVTVPDGVTAINPGAFANCTNLESISIPTTLQIIGTDAFAGCHSLQTVTYRGNLRQASKLRLYAEDSDDPLMQASWMLTKPNMSLTMALAFRKAGKNLLLLLAQPLAAGIILFLAKKARKPSYF